MWSRPQAYSKAPHNFTDHTYHELRKITLTARQFTDRNIRVRHSTTSSFGYRLSLMSYVLAVSPVVIVRLLFEVGEQKRSLSYLSKNLRRLGSLCIKGRGNFKRCRRQGLTTVNVPLLCSHWLLIKLSHYLMSRITSLVTDYEIR